ncbi:hypothetical protein F903_00372 [Acinetobacter sp. NIPH 298]|nr:hypothetical protein F903_00372 [Acinetobacter sp. NIPH 298]
MNFTNLYFIKIIVSVRYIYLKYYGLNSEN